ncbi:hypothetical protein [Roseomonas sp. CECT 9278]|uniref:hypothetical protein n=1 Tax=Roseomonas sp. CECT 9278 TaxID=2845823 RepID=UPI001E45AB83|nr:hypothetical protein [Roseomonas sp. CECT 9278]CAH0247125.1 hypothetical protein ROS9278_03045 [Roseomonas sp. CECT 9278]
MNKIRTVVAALCGVAIAAPALANTCLRPEERNVFELRALRSYLMVTALQCQKSEPYNQFIRRFGGDLTTADRAAQAHFTRAFGGAGRTRLDSYNTTMANEHSEDAIRGGSFFCRDADPLFQRVLATPAPQLAALAAERNIPQTYGDDCGATPAAAARPAARTATRTTSTPRR